MGALKEALTRWGPLLFASQGGGPAVCDQPLAGMADGGAVTVAGGGHVVIGPVGPLAAPCRKRWACLL